MAATLSLIAKRGYENVSIDEIAAATGNTKGAVYHHFTSKPELYREALLALARSLTDRAEIELDDRLPLADGMKRLLAEMLQSGATSNHDLTPADVYYLFFDGMRRFPDLSSGIQQLFRGYMTRMTDRLQARSRSRSDARARTEALQCLIWIEGIALVQAVTGGVIADSDVRAMVDRFFG